jgi:hypothetical protein
MATDLTVMDFWSIGRRYVRLGNEGGVLDDSSVWCAADVDARVPMQSLDPGGRPIVGKNGKPRMIKATTWLNRYRYLDLAGDEKSIGRGAVISLPSATFVQ